MTKTATILVCAGCAGPAAAQWVDYADETDARLALVNVDLEDNQEKDMVAADFDQDGWTDVVVVRKVPYSNPGARVDLLLMNEAGVLTDRTAELAPGFLETLTDARDVACADIDNDGDLDLVIAQTFARPPLLYVNKGWQDGVWLGFANESERVADVGRQSKPERFTSLDLGDIDGDGDVDIYYCNAERNDDLLHINDGTGVFTDETTARLGDLSTVAFGTRVQLHDVDLDGDLDVVKLSTLFSKPPFGVGLFILWNEGDGTFSEFDELPNNNPYDFDMGDYDQDGDLDAWVTQDPQDRYLHASVKGPQDVDWMSFEAQGSPRTAGFGGNTASVDLDLDGDLDVLVSPIDVDIASCDGDVYALLRNNGQGHFDDPWQEDQPWHTSAFDTAVLDIDNDGCVDLFQGLCHGYRVFIRTDCPCIADFDGDGSLTILDFVRFQLAFVAGDPAADCDDNGALEILDFSCFQAAFLEGC